MGLRLRRVDFAGVENAGARPPVIVARAAAERLGNQEPLVGLDTVRRHAFAGKVHGTQVVLCDRVALVGRLQVPVQCPCIVFGDTLAKIVQGSEVILCVGVTLPRGALVPHRGRRIVLIDSGTAVVQQADRVLADGLNPGRPPCGTSAWPRAHRRPHLRHAHT